VTEPHHTYYAPTGLWRLRAVKGIGLQYLLAFETLEDGWQQVAFDPNTFNALIHEAVGLQKNTTEEQKAELIKAAEEGEQHEEG
jgi:hypothetical protein